MASFKEKCEAALKALEALEREKNQHSSLGRVDSKILDPITELVARLDKFWNESGNGSQAFSPMPIMPSDEDLRTAPHLGINYVLAATQRVDECLNTIFDNYRKILDTNQIQELMLDRILHRVKALQEANFASRTVVRSTAPVKHRRSASTPPVDLSTLPGYKPTGEEMEKRGRVLPFRRRPANIDTKNSSSIDARNVDEFLGTHNRV